MSQIVYKYFQDVPLLEHCCRIRYEYGVYSEILTSFCINSAMRHLKFYLILYVYSSQCEVKFTFVLLAVLVCL